jgi:hypothetical protein
MVRYGKTASGNGAGTSMMNYVQETSSKIVYPFPGSRRFAFTPLNETFGGLENNQYLPWPIGTGIVSLAWDLTFKVGNKQLAADARRVLVLIQQTVTTLHKIGLDLSYLPQLQAFLAEDGSFLLEWIFSDYRIGFSIEPNEAESSWYLITNRKLGEVNAAGVLCGSELQTLVLWLLNFVLSHS